MQLRFQDMCGEWEMWQMRATSWSESLRGRNCFIDVGIHARTIPKLPEMRFEDVVWIQLAQGSLSADCYECESAQRWKFLYQLSDC